MAINLRKAVFRKCFTAAKEIPDTARLEQHDRLLLLFISFTEEHVYGNAQSLFWEGLSGDRNLNSLCEIATHIKQGSINWDYIFKRAQELHKSEEVLYAVKLFNHLCNGMIPTAFISKLDNEVLYLTHTQLSPKISFTKKMVRALVAIDLDDLLWGNINRHLVKAEYEILRAKNQVYDASHKRHTQLGSVRLNAQHVFKDMLKVNLGIKWDEQNLYLSLVFHGNLVSWQPDHSDIILNIGPGDVYYDKQIKHFIRCLILPIYLSEKIDYITAVWDYFQSNQEFAVPRHRYPYSFHRQGKGYEVAISLPWEYLGIVPQIGKQLWFDLQVKGRQNNNGEHNRYALFGFYDGLWDDPAKLGLLNLQG